jgi:hypothetical protein
MYLNTAQIIFISPILRQVETVNRRDTETQNDRKMLFSTRPSIAFREGDGKQKDSQKAGLTLGKGAMGGKAIRGRGLSGTGKPR